MEKLICANCGTTDTTEFRKEAVWDLCVDCYKSWLEHDEYLKKNPDEKTRNYYVTVTQTNNFHIEAKNEEDAKRIALEDYIWDEAQTYPNTYSYKIDAVKD